MIRDCIIVVIGTLILLSVMGGMEERDRQTAEAHKHETIAAAKKEFTRRKREEWAELEAQAERLTFPVSAYPTANRERP
jgi:hypothetical protein